MDNILDYAINMESDGEDYYREMAGKSGSPEIAAVLNFLADQEVKHKELLSKIKAEQRPSLEKGTFKEDVKNIFLRLKEENVDLSDCESAVDLYKKAQKLEQVSRDFYVEKAESIEDPMDKELFYKIADEERLHYLMLDTVIDFVQRPEPGNWLENAEWSHSEEY